MRAFSFRGIPKGDLPYDIEEFYDPHIIIIGGVRFSPVALASLTRDQIIETVERHRALRRIADMPPGAGSDGTHYDTWQRMNSPADIERMRSEIAKRMDDKLERAILHGSTEPETETFMSTDTQEVMELIDVTTQAAGPGMVRLLAKFRHPHNPLRNEQWMITATRAEVRCGCANFKTWKRCAHIGLVVAQGFDKWVIEDILNTEALGSTQVNIPLFDLPSWTNKNGQDVMRLGYFWQMVTIARKIYPAGVMGEVSIEVPLDINDPRVQAYEGSYSAAGKTVHRLGLVSAMDGREAIRAMVSAWIASQMAHAHEQGVKIECDDYYHDRSPGALPMSELSKPSLESMTIFLTGECLSCRVNEGTPDEDLPF